MIIFSFFQLCLGNARGSLKTRFASLRAKLIHCQLKTWSFRGSDLGLNHSTTVTEADPSLDKMKHKACMVQTTQREESLQVTEKVLVCQK